MIGSTSLRAATILAVFLAVAWSAVGGEVGDSDSVAGETGWSVDLEAYLYLLEDDSYLLPIFSAEKGSLHLEGRYQYEDLRTASVWAGWIFQTGEVLEFEVVPMAGVVVGRTDGLAAGFELTLAWRSLDLYTENEFVFDFEDSDGNFFYSWSELSWQAEPWLRLGLSAQVTRETGSGFETDPGILVGIGHGPAELILYGFDLGGDDAFYIVALAWEF